MAVVGDDLTAEVMARALGAGGVGTLRFIHRSGLLDAALASALRGSNPDLRLETRPWPQAGTGWLAALDGCAMVVRSGFDDDAMLRAAIRLGVPVVVVRADDAGVDLVSFRRHGPCPHVSLDVAEGAAAATGSGPTAVIAAHAAAAEALLLLAGTRLDEARARHLRLPLSGEGDGADAAPRTTDIPWTPECFACGGSASEMSFGGH
ncbi:MAG TPA: hypothetical protein VGP07_02310 [Polyangia bacterium]